jgi:hypothetical protein
MGLDHGFESGFGGGFHGCAAMASRC